MVDCTIEEELCSNCQISIAVDQAGHVLSTSMEGVGSIPYGKMSSIIMVGVAEALRLIIIYPIIRWLVR